MHGFEIVRYPTYMSVRRVYGSDDTASMHSGRSSRSHGSRGNLEAMDSNLDAGMTFSKPAPAAEVAATRYTSNLKTPKYANFSMQHMCDLETHPDLTKTGRSLQKVLSAPTVGRG